MNSLPKHSRFALFILIPILSFSVLSGIAKAQQASQGIFIALGSEDPETFPGMLTSIISQTQKTSINLLILPVTLSTNPDEISLDDSEKILEKAELLRQRMKQACQEYSSALLTCQISIASVVTRSDARNPKTSQVLTPDISAVYFPDGNPAIAMQVIANTRFEEALEKAFQHGLIIVGAGDGANILAKNMVAGYTQGYSSWNALNFGSVDLWNSGGKRGLSVGLQDNILDNHVFAKGNLVRLLNAISLPGIPHLGIGVDAKTGVVFSSSKLESIFGKSAITILDAETYHSADAIQYRGIQNLPSLRNILLHILGPGDIGLDLTRPQLSFEPAPAQLKRAYKNIATPRNAGPLFLTSDVTGPLDTLPLLTDFVNRSEGSRAKILIITVGYSSAETAEHVAQQCAQALQVQSQVWHITDTITTNPYNLDNFSGLLVTSDNQALLEPHLAQINFIKDFWLSGKPVLARNAAAAALGAFFYAYGPTPEELEQAEAFSQQSFLLGKTKNIPGLGLLNMLIEPQIMYQNRWRLLLSLAYHHPEIIALGLAENATLEITAEGARVTGDNAVFVLDMEIAKLGVATNGTLTISNALLDVFGPGDLVKPEPADMDFSPIHAPTPLIPLPTITGTPSPTPSPAPTFTPSPTASTTPTGTDVPGRPTRTPKQTPTPLTIPPPSDPNKSNLMIGFGILTVLVILVGVWINRRRVI